MQISVEDHAPYGLPVSDLEFARDVRRAEYFNHVDPGGLTGSEKKAWHLEHFALQLFLEAAQGRLDAEIEMRKLLTAEALPHV